MYMYVYLHVYGLGFRALRVHIYVYMYICMHACCFLFFGKAGWVVGVCVSISLLLILC